MSDSRIFFKNNPYPLGHVIKEFVWGGHMDEDGQLWFDLPDVCEKHRPLGRCWIARTPKAFFSQPK